MAKPVTHEDIDKKIEEYQAKRQKIQKEANGSNKIGLISQGHFDKDIYAPAGSKYEGYLTSIGTAEDDEDEDDLGGTPAHTQFTATNDIIQEVATAGEDHAYDPFKESRQRKIMERHDEYHLRQVRHMIISPARADPFFEV